MSDHLVDMKLSKKQAKNEVCCADDEKGPRYPYGLAISLDDDSLKKLGFDGLPAVGTEMIVVGVGKITRASENHSQRGLNRDVSIQLERVEVEPFTKPTDKTAVDAVTKAIKEV